MIIFRENKQTGLQCGLNDFGELFIGDKKSGANLKDTPENREYLLREFAYWNDETDEDPDKHDEYQRMGIDYSPSNPWDAPGMSMRDFI